MVFILKRVLIILLNKTYALITQDSEIVLLPAWNPTEAKEISLTLKIFGKLVQLNLHKNDQFVSSAFKIWKYNANNVTEKLSKLKTSNSCFYIHEDDVSSAAINICQKHGLEGLIFVENDVLEIRPLWNIFAPLPFVDDYCVRQQINQSFGTSYFVKKLQQHFAGSNLYHLLHKMRSGRHFINKKQKSRYTIELAIFVDATAYRAFMPLLNNNISNICNMMFTYVNQMQAFFHHPSLGYYVDLVLTRLFIMPEQLPNVPTYEDDIRQQLYAFCWFASRLNLANDKPNRWDISLYVSGLDFYKSGNIFTGKDYTIWGESYFNHACGSLSCVIVEFLPHEVVSSGIRSSLNAVYQIGLLLGVKEDESNIGSDSYVMSPERPYHGEITWSQQSRVAMRFQLQRRSCFKNHPKPKNVETKKSDDDNNSLCETLPRKK